MRDAGQFILIYSEDISKEPEGTLRHLTWSEEESGYGWVRVCEIGKLPRYAVLNWSVKDLPPTCPVCLALKNAREAAEDIAKAFA